MAENPLTPHLANLRTYSGKNKGEGKNNIDEAHRQRQNTILQKRREGVSFREIADQLGLSNGYVYKTYKNALKLIIVENVVEVRKMELARLDILQNEVIKVLQSFTPLVSAGRVVYDYTGEEEEDDDGVVNRLMQKLPDQSIKFAAINSALKIMERRAKLLGLDAPVKAEVSGPDGGAIPVAVEKKMTREELIIEAAARGLPSTIFEQ